MMRSFLLFAFPVYAVGAVVSQSLMSLAGGLFALLVLLRLPALKFRQLTSSERLAVLSGSAWLIFSVANLLFRPWDDRVWHTLGTLPLLLIPLLPLTGALRKLSVKDLQLSLGLAAFAVLISTGLCLWQYFVEDHVAYGFMKNQIYFAYNVFPAFVFFSELYVRRIKVGRFRASWAGLVALLCILEMLLSNTRMVWAGTLAYLALRVLPFLLLRRGPRFALLAVLGTGAVCTGAYFLMPAVQQKVQRTLNVQDENTQARFAVWNYNWKLFLENPLTGVGPEKNGADRSQIPYFVEGFRHYAHSIYMQPLADSGLLGTILFFTFWIALGIAMPLARPLILGLALVGLTENIFNNSKAAHAVYFFTLFAGSLGVLLRGRERA
jgi:hypothetical protein